MSVTAKKKLRVFKRDNFTCKGCKSSKDLTIDHVIPQSKGGSDDESNLRTLCFKCNFEKGDTIRVPRFLKRLAPTIFFWDDASNMRKEINQSIKDMKLCAVNESNQIIENTKPALKEYIANFNKDIKLDVSGLVTSMGISKRNMLDLEILMTDTRSSISKNNLEAVTRDNQLMAIIRLMCEKMEDLESRLDSYQK